jgi:hypothetical protein
MQWCVREQYYNMLHDLVDIVQTVFIALYNYEGLKL